jgi:hypothetical protein
VLYPPDLPDPPDPQKKIPGTSRSRNRTGLRNKSNPKSVGLSRRTHRSSGDYMTGRKKLFIAAAIFTAINFAGGIFAQRSGEMMHAMTHMVLFLLGAVATFALRGERSGPKEQLSDQEGQVDETITRLQQAVDAIAVEVERVGEGQRSMNVLMSEAVKEPSAREEK